MMLKLNISDDEFIKAETIFSKKILPLDIIMIQY